MKYLYAASVEGIQPFIFETNKLAEIARASEMVEDICTTIFDEFTQKYGIQIEEKHYIQQTAGNIKISSLKEEDAKKIVRYFPLEVQRKCPGVRLNQITTVENDKNGAKIFDDLSKKLNYFKSKEMKPFVQGQTISERCSRTGKPVAYETINAEGKKVRIDLATKIKRKKKDKGEEKANRLLNILDVANTDKFPREVDHIATKENKNWIAVVHADGNGLGKKILDLTKKLKKVKDYGVVRKIYRSFSKCIAEATEKAIGKAFKETIEITNNIYPFRPIIIGGDDITIICRGDLAIPFTKKYLTYFEEFTKEKLAELAKEYKQVSFPTGLTACAGIAFAKVNYPFHYSCSLAEDLCRYAKKQNESNDISSLMFHRISSSFHDDFDTTMKQELTCGKTSLTMGGYTIREGKNLPYLEDLLELVDIFAQHKEAPHAAFRKLLKELRTNSENAEQLMYRVRELLIKRNELLLEKIENLLCKLWNKSFKHPPLAMLANHNDDTHDDTPVSIPVLDVLVLLSIRKDKK